MTRYMLAILLFVTLAVCGAEGEKDLRIAISDPYSLLGDRGIPIGSEFWERDFKMIVVRPDPGIDYKLITVVPDPKTRFKMIVIDPNTRRELSLPMDVEKRLRSLLDRPRRGR
jgi:hypothetical protein